MKFSRFDPAHCAFPLPCISVLPDRPQLARRLTRRQTGRPAANHFRHFTRGRYALGEAYRLAGVGRQGALLAPAYHCVTMLDPALALGADIELYPLHADLSPDLEKLDERLMGYGKPVKALLATHFFGFPQDFSTLKQWCDEHQIALIEDCSHVLFTEDFQTAGTGIYGRFVVASPYKFFPCEDGGLLYSPATPLINSVPTQSASLIDELRGIKRLLDRLRRAGAVPCEIDAIDRQLTTFDASTRVVGGEQIVERSRASAQYCANEANAASRRSSRALVRHSSLETTIRQRRENYRQWAQALRDTANCRVLRASLPEDCAPYMFALHIADPATHFYRFKQLGVPLWRWDEIAVSDCPIARDYRLHLIHLPCHQSLSEAQMAWMIAAVTKTLRHPMLEVR